MTVNIAQVTTDDQRLEKDLFMYRSYLAQNKARLVADEIQPLMASQLQDVKYLANYCLADQRKRCSLINQFNTDSYSIIYSVNRDIILQELETKIQTLDPNDWYKALMFATIYYNENHLETALRVLHSSDNLEW